MKKVNLIINGVIAIFMVRSAFYISPTINQFNIWILIGAAIMLILAIQNYILKDKSLPTKQRVLNKSYDIKTPKEYSKMGNLEIDENLRVEVQALVDNNKAIQAIKLIRERTGLGLKESKEFLELNFKT